MVAAIERGWVQREIEDAAYRHQQAVDSGESVVVGVNRFVSPSEDSPAPPARKVDETAERGQIERVRALRVRRDSLRWQSSTRPGHGAGSLLRERYAGNPGGGRELRHGGRDCRKPAPGFR